MIQLAPTEHILLVIRRHWFAYLSQALLVVVLAVPPLALGWASVAFPALADPAVNPVVNFLIAHVNLFHRKVSEIALERVQNVTIEIPGLIPTLLKFGNLKIQTAGEGSFTIIEVPDLYHAKELILKHSRRPAPHPVETASGVSGSSA